MNDLSGTWSGFYEYNLTRFSMRVSFTATLNQAAGGARFIGQITDYAVEQATKLQAIVSGKLDGEDVRFTKHYTTITADPVNYRGQLARDVIRGSWVIEQPNGERPTGTFEMWRLGLVEKEQEENSQVDELFAELNLSVTSDMSSASNT